jgi:hypothetical protein
MVALAGLLILGAAVGCAGPPPLEPDVTVLRWMQAFAAQDGDTVARLTCRAGQSDNQNSRLLSMALGVPVGANYGGAGSQFLYGTGGGQPTYDVSGLRYETTGVTDNSARVKVTGLIRLTSGSASQTLPMNSSIGLIREQDQWRVCDSASA